MFTRFFHPDRFLQSVYDSEPFSDFCRARQIPFEQGQTSSLRTADRRRWAAALAQLPHDQQAQVELELATVNEMAGSQENAHLIEAAADDALPPASVPQGAALALWFFLHHPVLFHEVFLHHEIQEVASWRAARAAPNLALPDLDGRAAALAESLRAFFRVPAGMRFCTVDAHRLTEAVCFIVQIADRLHFLDVFTDSGKVARRRLRPALPVLFVYYPADGTVLLKSHLRSADRVDDLFHHFGWAALSSPTVGHGDTFNLEPLKQAFHPLPDAADMDLIRVKALHLRYPARSGRRQLKLETLASDGKDSIDQMLRSHIDPLTLTQLRVCHAELQVRLRVSGGSKHYLIRLWPNRCNLSQTPLGDRFRACLRRWGLCHAHQS